jgi:hypothetical protein
MCWLEVDSRLKQGKSIEEGGESGKKIPSEVWFQNHFLVAIGFCHFVLDIFAGWTPKESVPGLLWPLRCGDHIHWQPIPLPHTTVFHNEADLPQCLGILP